MADEPHVIRGIDWKQTFPFVTLFRGFRVAIHPSKLILALLALILILAGGKFLDAVWSRQSSAVPNEMELYAASLASDTPSADFKTARDKAWTDLQSDKASALEAAGNKGGDLGYLKWWIQDQRKQAVQTARDAFDKSKKDEAAHQQLDAAVSAAYSEAASEWEHARKLNGVGLFDTFYDNEVGALNNIVLAVRANNWGGAPGSVIDSIASFFVFAPMWALHYHPVFF